MSCSNLRLEHIDGCFDDTGLLPRNLSLLTQLTALTVASQVTQKVDVSPLFGLPRLESILIDVGDAQGLVSSIATQSMYLTSLTFGGAEAESVRPCALPY